MGVSSLTPIATPKYHLYESADIWCRSRPGGKENDPYTHDKICDPVERCPCAGPYGATLSACGSDEPSGVTGPDRTASTPTETPSSPTRTPTTTGSEDAPTATDAPAAATAPPEASDSVEKDREALVALYNAAAGFQWVGISNYTEDEVKWLSDAPLGEWEGVTTDDDGRVIGLSLSGYRLLGEIPAELGSLSRLEILENALAGEIPAELGSLSNLTELQERVERGDTARVGQPLQPDRARPERL